MVENIIQMWNNETNCQAVNTLKQILKQNGMKNYLIFFLMNTSTNCIKEIQKHNYICTVKPEYFKGV